MFVYRVAIILFRKEKKKGGRAEQTNQYGKANFFLSLIAGGIYVVFFYMRGMLDSSGFNHDFT